MDRDEILAAWEHCGQDDTVKCHGCPNLDGESRAAGRVICREISERCALVPVALIERTVALLKAVTPTVGCLGVDTLGGVQSREYFLSCGACGRPLDNGDRFCRWCGKENRFPEHGTDAAPKNG